MPDTLHQRTPLVIGSREDVGFVADTLRRASSASKPVSTSAL
jgi:fructose-1,6-bisphosphatase